MALTYRHSYERCVADIRHSLKSCVTRLKTFTRKFFVSLASRHSDIRQNVVSQTSSHSPECRLSPETCTTSIQAFIRKLDHEHQDIREKVVLLAFRYSSESCGTTTRHSSNSCIADIQTSIRKLCH
jgi:hypothetical protein